MPVWPVYFAE